MLERLHDLATHLHLKSILGLHGIHDVCNGRHNTARSFVVFMERIWLTCTPTVDYCNHSMPLSLVRGRASALLFACCETRKKPTRREEETTTTLRRIARINKWVAFFKDRSFHTTTLLHHGYTRSIDTFWGKHIGDTLKVIVKTCLPLSIHIIVNGSKEWSI
mgnify:CR=1 FL=1